MPHIPLAKPGHRTKTKVRESSKHILPSVNHGKGERKRKNCKQIMPKNKKKASLVAQLVKNPLVVQDTACNAGETRAISGLGRSSGEENGNLLQYSCLGNPMDRGASWATVHGVAELDMTQWINHQMQRNPTAFHVACAQKETGPSYSSWSSTT